MSLYQRLTPEELIRQLRIDAAFNLAFFCLGIAASLIFQAVVS